MYEQELAVALQSARTGGVFVARHFENGPTLLRGKQSYNLVSAADLESEQAIAETIHAAFPQHAILGEEAHQGDVAAEHLWVVDPLDGTNNFAHGVPHCAVSVAYCCRGTPVCGVVWNPLRHDLYHAVQGQGAFFNGRPIQVGAQERLDQVLVGVGFYYDRGAMMEATLAAMGDFFRQQIHGIRRFGAASLDLCQVACGMYGAFFEYELAPWDFAAGGLILQEAGGKLSTGRGTPLTLQKSSLLASNTKLHSAALEIVRRHHPAVPATAEPG